MVELKINSYIYLIKINRLILESGIAGIQRPKVSFTSPIVQLGVLETLEKKLPNAINILKNHRVVNNSNVDRIHMIAQAHIGNKRKAFNELLDRSIQKYGVSI